MSGRLAAHPALRRLSGHTDVGYVPFDSWKTALNPHNMNRTVWSCSSLRCRCCRRGHADLAIVWSQKQNPVVGLESFRVALDSSHREVRYDESRRGCSWWNRVVASVLPGRAHLAGSQMNGKECDRLVGSVYSKMSMILHPEDLEASCACILAAIEHEVGSGRLGIYSTSAPSIATAWKSVRNRSLVSRRQRGTHPDAEDCVLPTRLSRSSTFAPSRSRARSVVAS